MLKISLFIILLFMSGITSYSQTNVKYPLLKYQIDSLKVIDQKVQQDYIRAKSDDRTELLRIENEVFARHTKILKEILDNYGYPNKDMVGEESSRNYWLCVQHCDHDPKFQRKVLRFMKKEVRKGKADPENYAYLMDRVKLNMNKSQIFGTQVTYVNGKAKPKSLKKTYQVDKLRQKFGLEPLSEYLKSMTEMHKLMNENRSDLQIKSN